MMVIVPESTNIKPLEVKYPIIGWEVFTDGRMMGWKIIRLGGITERYKLFEDLLKGFDREDLNQLWSLVKERFRVQDPTEDKDKELWVQLKRIYEPDRGESMWRFQAQIEDVSWKLFDMCGVHRVSTKDGIEIYMLVEKDYPLRSSVLTSMLYTKLRVEEDSEMADLLVTKIFNLAEQRKISSKRQL